MENNPLVARVVFLNGLKVILRPIMKDDIPTTIRWINDPEVREYISTTFPIGEKQEDEWLNKLYTSNTDIVLAIETLDGKYIGNMGIHNINWVNRTATTGALIGEKEYRNKGYGTDAKMALLDYAFNTLNLRKIYSEVIAFNKRSLSYSLHCGYKFEGKKKKHIFRNGKYWDQITLCLYKKDWIPYWEKYKKNKKS